MDFFVCFEREGFPLKAKCLFEAAFEIDFHTVFMVVVGGFVFEFFDLKGRL